MIFLNDENQTGGEKQQKKQRSQKKEKNAVIPLVKIKENPSATQMMHNIIIIIIFTITTNFMALAFLIERDA